MNRKVLLFLLVPLLLWGEESGSLLFNSTGGVITSMQDKCVRNFAVEGNYWVFSASDRPFFCFSGAKSFQYRLWLELSPYYSREESEIKTFIPYGNGILSTESRLNNISS